MSQLFDKTGRGGCPVCSAWESRLLEAGKAPRREYMPIIEMFQELERRGVVELLAGDCPLEEAARVLEAEQHYTVCHYLQCKSCGAVYFVGACIRGTPIYRKVDRLDWDKIRRQLWGRCGSVDLSGGNKL